MSRQYVHLSEDIETAKMAGKRRDSDPVILYIDTVEAMMSEHKVISAPDIDEIFAIDEEIREKTKTRFLKHA